KSRDRASSENYTHYRIDIPSRADQGKNAGRPRLVSFCPYNCRQPPPVMDLRVCRDYGLSPAERQPVPAQSRGSGQRKRWPLDRRGGISCIGRCAQAPTVTINDHIYRGKTEAAM